MPAYNFRGYRSASSRFIEKVFNGIKVEAVLARVGTSGSSTEYLAICRPADRHGNSRVVNYNHVVQAAAGTVDLRSKYNISLTPTVHGLVSADAPAAVAPAAAPVSNRTLVGAIRNQASSASGTVDLDSLDLAGALFVMNKLVIAAKRDENIGELVKLIATTL